MPTMNVDYSIVIPTRNRPGLIGDAIRRALCLDHSSFEVLLSDNSSDKRTIEAIREIDDPRFRVVRTSGDLKMHESWAFAAAQARGTWIIILCDDDAHHPELLTILDRMTRRYPDADAIAWARCGYMHNAIENQPARAARMEFRTIYSDGVYEIDGRALIDDAYAMRVSHNDFIPRMLNTAVRRELFTLAAEKGSPFFRPSCPDYSSMLTLALHAKRLLFLDAPLSMTGLLPESTGWAASQRAEVDPEFVNGFLEAEGMYVLPPALLTTCCWIAQTYLQLARDDPHLSGRIVDLVRTYIIAGQEIEGWRRLGFDVATVESGLDRAITFFTPEDGQTIRSGIQEGITFESDRFLRLLDDEDDETLVLGCGPVLLSDRHIPAGELASMSLAASNLPAWIDQYGIRLGDLISRLSDTAAGRTIIIYGLGNGGKMLCRCLSARDSGLPFSWRGHDDGYREIMPGAKRLSKGDSLDPARHFVFITPLSARGISRRLEDLSFQPGRDWLTPGDLICGDYASAAGATR